MVPAGWLSARVGVRGRYRMNVSCVAFGHIETRLTPNDDGEPPTIQVGDQQLPAGIDATSASCPST